jgi:hypothetical protein
MQDSDSLMGEISQLISRYGKSKVRIALENAAANDSNGHVCTIIANRGIHIFPEEILIGDIFVFSEGMVDFTSKETIKREISENLFRLTDFLREKKWKSVYLVISGHAILSMQIKLLVYRVTRLETVDWFFDGAGRYIPIDIHVRALIASARGHIENHAKPA